MITSSSNPRLKWVRQLLESSKERRQSQAFVVEGVRLAEEALEAGWQAHWVLYHPDISERGQVVVQRFSAAGAQVESIAPGLLRSVGETETPQGILVVLALQEIPLPPQPNLLFIPDQISDPGNLGTLLRTCAAAGVQGVLVPPGTSDPWAPKVVRAGMGAHFRLPLIHADWPAIAIQVNGMAVYLATVQQGMIYTQVDFRQRLALVVGSEAHGPGPEAQHLAHHRVYIPMPGGSESLNAAIAAGILLFEIVRQRTPA